MSNLPKVSFNEAAINLSLLCQKIDAEENIDDILLAEFQDAVSNVSQSIDRRKYFYRELESKIDMAKAYRDEVTKHIKRYEKIKERLIEVTKNIIISNPDIPFKDTLGKQLKVIPNPVPKLVINDNAPTDNHEYIQITVTKELNKELIKSDLLHGKQIDWAYIEYGTQLRGMK